MPQRPAAIPMARPAAIIIAALTEAGGFPAASWANAGAASIPITGSIPNIAANFFILFLLLVLRAARRWLPESLGGNRPHAGRPSCPSTDRYELNGRAT